jgi:two-component system cell cycle sensor histidine kinase/response regulator CckA
VHRFSASPIRQLPADDYRRWVLVGSSVAAVGFTAVSVVGIWDPAGAAENVKRIAAAAVLWVAVGTALRGREVVAALLTLAAVWVEINLSFLSTPTFPANGMLVTPALVAASVLLLGPRNSLAFAIISIAITGPLLRLSPSLAATGYTRQAILWLTVYSVVTLALWAITALSLSALERVLREVIEKERDLADTILHAPDGIIIVGPGDRVQSANPAAERVLGVGGERLIGRSMDDVLLDIGVDTGLPAALRRGPAAELPVPMVVARADGQRVHLEVTFHLMEGDRRQLMLRDVTERVHAEQSRREMEAHLAHAQRMEAVGQLAGGIAHDFNNLLTAVGGSAELLRPEISDPAQASLLDDIMAAQERGAGLTRQLLAFARREIIQPRVFNLSSQVAGLQRLLQRVAGEQTRVFCDLEPDCRVLADVGQIEQALVNLVTNARDAMPAGGPCAVRVARAKDDGGRTWVRLSVTDEGVGMTESIRERAFEPFFTTKSRGRGTGLGLASVHGIALQSGGCATIESTPGRGTTVTIELPFADAPAAATPAESQPAVAARSGGTILVAEDDDSTRSVVNRVLQRAGYQVLLAPDGVQALRIVESQASAIDLLLTDVIMPGLTGPQLSARAHEHVPHLPVLFMSGYPADALSEVSGLQLETDFIAKPFASAALLQRVAMKLGAG